MPNFKQTVEIQSPEQLPLLLGNFDENLNFLADELQVIAYVDGEKLHLEGGEEGVRLAAKVLSAAMKLCEKLCDKHEIPYTVLASPMGTGTNATSVNLVGLGIPVVDVGLPLASMHTYVEVISMTDALTLCDLVSRFICDKDIAAKMTQREEIEL